MIPTYMSTVPDRFAQKHHRENGSERDVGAASSFEGRRNTVQDWIRRYVDIHERMGMIGSRRFRERLTWLDETALTDDPRDPHSIRLREDFFRGEGRQMIEEGERMHRLFYEHLDRASPYMSHASRERWIQQRYLNDNIGFQEKRYWIERQMPSFVENWISVGKERDAIAEDPRLEHAVQMDPELRVLLDREKFLDLHYDKKTNLLKQARAAILSATKERAALYAQAKVKLLGAKSEGILAASKVGVWMERIFTADATSEQIDTFINGSGAKSMEALMENWRVVKYRYDRVKEKLKGRTELSAVRGFTLLSEGRFLDLHYESRLQYVKEVEQRLGDSPNPQLERDIFIEIRHAMDTRDWAEAASLIREARKIDDLTSSESERLSSMSAFVRQFGGRESKSENSSGAADATKRIDQIVAEMGATHPQLVPLIRRLLRGKDANRSIHQFRWIAYNNKWCRTHGYLDDEVSRYGASKQSEEVTRLKVEMGEDSGLHNNLGRTTEETKYIREDSGSPTFRHVDLSDGAVLEREAIWLEGEQNPSVLYWTTFCGYEERDPKSANWHDDLVLFLTELRKQTRILKKAGVMYGQTSLPQKNDTAAPEFSYAVSA